MHPDLYERIRTKLFGGHKRNSFEPLLRDRAEIRGPVRGTPEEFSQVLYELTRGELKKRNETVAYEAVAQERCALLKFRDGSLFRVVKAKDEILGPLVVITPYEPSLDDLLNSKEAPLAGLVSDVLMIREAFNRVADEYRREELHLAAAKAGAEIRMARESRLEAIVETIEGAKSGETIMVRGMQNIDALVRLGFVPCLVDNPDTWVDAEDYPGLRYRHDRSGIEMLLTGRERFRPIEELNKLEFYFLVNRSDDALAEFARMAGKFSVTRKDGTAYGAEEFRADLLALVKYPEELKGRTEEDLGIVADEVEVAIDRRQELDKGILPYEAVFRKDTQAIVDHVRRSRTPAGEVRKALDYFEYTGMIDGAYKAVLKERIAEAVSAPPAASPGLQDVLYDKRVKEIVADVLRKIPRERLTPLAVTIALTPYVNELGFGRLVKIRERILQLKDMVHDQQQTAS